LNTLEAFQRGYRHKNLPFWLGLMRAPGLELSQDSRVIDIGCGTGLFLQLLYEETPYAHGLGIDNDTNSIAQAEQSLATWKSDRPIQYEANDFLSYDAGERRFDYAFCQEVFWMVEDLPAFADRVRSTLTDDGVCYATCGMHANNALFEHKRALLQREGFEPAKRSIDEIADTFASKGFAVGIRPLPVAGYVMYDRETTAQYSKSLYELCQSTFRDKLLFVFYNERDVHTSESLRG
jgi:SAM-dependent methyltransferase